MNCSCPDGKIIHPMCADCAKLRQEIDNFDSQVIRKAVDSVAKTDSTLAYLLNEIWLDGCRSFSWDGRTVSGTEWTDFLDILKFFTEKAE